MRRFRVKPTGTPADDDPLSAGGIDGNAFSTGKGEGVANLWGCGKKQIGVDQRCDEIDVGLRGLAWIKLCR